MVSGSHESLLELGYMGMVAGLHLDAEYSSVD